MPVPAREPSSSPAQALAGLAAQVLVTSLFGLFVAENRLFANAFISTPVWEYLILVSGGQIIPTPSGQLGVVSFPAILLTSVLGCLVANGLTAWGQRKSYGTLLAAWNSCCWSNTRWMLPLLLWIAVWVANLLWPTQLLFGILMISPGLAFAVMMAGFLCSAWPVADPSSSLPDKEDAAENSGRRINRTVIASILVYTLVFTALNWGLWFNLLIPHGDSSMYEEHLWNVLHGKGFRSYLDQGLFLGEHIQVVHLLLLPAYILWPSHLLLELAQSLIIALTAIPVYSIALRHSRSRRAATCIALATLLYFPLQYLDIAIDLKTFRPNAFGIPALLCAIDALERRRWGWVTFWFLLTLSSQEDFAIVIALIGGWLALESWRQRLAAKHDGDSVIARASTGALVAGVLTFALSTLYLIAAVKYVIPWFRGGETVHYVRYFEKFGKTAPVVVWNMVTRPDLVVSEFLHVSSVAYLLMLLVPLGIPWGWIGAPSDQSLSESGEHWIAQAWKRNGRMLIGLPLYLLLCLNQVAQQTPGPFHHFHAPLIPVLLWGVCAGLGEVDIGSPEFRRRRAESVARWVLCCALATQMFFTVAPTGLAFWDPGSRSFWRRLYIPDERAKEFAKVLPLIPATARVASTDFVHPRFTHCERSYDYSDYPRRVSDYLPKVPDDTDFIVIDTAHPYSVIHRPEEMRELREHPERWRIVPVPTQGYYIVLERVPSSGNSAAKSPP